MWIELEVPLQLAGLCVQLDDRVGVQVRARPARSPRVLRVSWKRRRVAHTEGHPAFAVEGRRVPDSAAGADLRVTPQVFRHSVEMPPLFAGFRVQPPKGPYPPAFVT